MSKAIPEAEGCASKQLVSSAQRHMPAVVYEIRIAGCLVEQHCCRHLTLQNGWQLSLQNGLPWKVKGMPLELALWHDGLQGTMHALPLEVTILGAGLHRRGEALPLKVLVLQHLKLSVLQRGHDLYCESGVHDM